MAQPRSGYDQKMMKRILLVSILLIWATTLAGAQTARVLFLGESHRSESDHRGQLAVLQGLSGEQLVVAAEMFTPRSNSFLEKWNEVDDGEITEELWAQEWGHPFELYKEIFDWTRGRAVLAALRPQKELTSTVKEGGPLAAVSHIGEMLVGPSAYRELLRGIFAEHMPTDVPITEEMVDRYFLVQCFWDEYMAWRIEQLADQYPEHRIVVLVGYGHLHPQYGIPARLSRRRPDLKMVNIAFDEERREECDLLLWVEADE
jgi:uncharacterized iron-regulated protein